MRAVELCTERGDLVIQRGDEPVVLGLFLFPLANLGLQGLPLGFGQVGRVLCAQVVTSSATVSRTFFSDT